MKSCLITPAWGLGDWIIVNPIIRILSKQYDLVGLLYNDYCKKFLKYMFSDLNNIHLEYDCGNRIPDIPKIKQYCKDKNIIHIDLMTPGKFNNEGIYIIDPCLDKPFNRFIYEKAGFNWEKDCKNYFIPINENESLNFFESLKLPEKYIFLHEGPYPKIDKNYINDKSLYTFVPYEIENVFLYKHVIENAKEIHVVDSGFYNFSDKLDLKTNKIYLHRTKNKTYQTHFLEPKLNKNWIKIDY